MVSRTRLKVTLYAYNVYFIFSCDGVAVVLDVGKIHWGDNYDYDYGRIIWHRLNH